MHQYKILNRERDKSPDELRRENKDLQREILVHKEKASRLAEENKKLLKDIKYMREEKKHLKYDIENLQDEIAELKAKLERRRVLAEA
ncbi:MAG: hypothetical protein AB1458_16310 [Bacteroidota bacterium]